MRWCKNIFGFLALSLYVLALINSFAPKENSAYNTGYHNAQHHKLLTSKQENKQPFQWFEISVTDSGLSVLNQEFPGFAGLSYAFKTQTRQSLSYVLYDYPSFELSDRRKLIFQYLFPFHFFW